MQRISKNYGQICIYEYKAIKVLVRLIYYNVDIIIEIRHVTVIWLVNTERVDLDPPNRKYVVSNVNGNVVLRPMQRATLLTANWILIWLNWFLHREVEYIIK